MSKISKKPRHYRMAKFFLQKNFKWLLFKIKYYFPLILALYVQISSQVLEKVRSA